MRSFYYIHTFHCKERLLESEKQYEIKENFWENLISSKAFPWENFSGTVATLRRNVVWIFPH